MNATPGERRNGEATAIRTAGQLCLYERQEVMTPKDPDPPRASQARDSDLDPETLEELQRLARSTPRSGR